MIQVAQMRSHESKSLLSVSFLSPRINPGELQELRKRRIMMELLTEVNIDLGHCVWIELSESFMKGGHQRSMSIRSGVHGFRCQSVTGREQRIVPALIFSRMRVMTNF